jgi:hypothetical protein
MGKDPSAIREEIELARRRMGDTVEAIAYKTDVSARARGWARHKVRDVRTAATRARGRLSSRGLRES